MASKKNMLSALVLGGGGLLILLLAFIISFREGFYITCKSGERLMGGLCKSEKQLSIIQPNVVAAGPTGTAKTVKSP